VRRTADRTTSNARRGASVPGLVDHGILRLEEFLTGDSYLHIRISRLLVASVQVSSLPADHCMIFRVACSELRVVTYFLIVTDFCGLSSLQDVVFDGDHFAIELALVIFVNRLLRVLRLFVLHSSRAEEHAEVGVVESAHDELAHALEEFLSFVNQINTYPDLVVRHLLVVNVADFQPHIRKPELRHRLVPHIKLLFGGRLSFHLAERKRLTLTRPLRFINPVLASRMMLLLWRRLFNFLRTMRFARVLKIINYRGNTYLGIRLLVLAGGAIL
jgi:hypothetical protein